MLLKIIKIAIILNINSFVCFSQTNQKDTAIIFLPVADSSRLINCFIEDIKNPELNFKKTGVRVNKAFYFSRNVDDAIEHSKSSFVIEIDSTKYIESLHLDLKKIKIFSLLQMCQKIATEYRPFIKRYQFLLLTNFSGQFRFYPVTRGETFYGVE